jgi:selenide,water dikinase
MQRSMMLGHCICNAHKSCPCELFIEKDVCQCAGERASEAVGSIQLTKLVEHTGCASKINQKDLKIALSGLPEITDPRVLVGTNTCDDAGVYRLDDETALVQTVDVFTPSVDDPYTFGQIAAANSLSDVYAMGGKPLTALSIIGFPADTVDLKVMTRMLDGGMDKMREAGVVILGGHSINDPSPKFGFAVTGTVNPSRMVTNANAQPGDLLVLTKPVGVGVIGFANQLGRVSESACRAASESMAELNRLSCEIMLEIGIRAATDVTGFGLLGHLSEMVCQSGVSAELYADRVPMFDEVLQYLSQGMISGTIERNMESASEHVIIDGDVSEECSYALYDPQTSGGLLISVTAERADALVDRLVQQGIRHAAIVGKIISGSQSRIFVRNAGQVRRVSQLMSKEVNAMVEDRIDSCCCAGGQQEVGTPADSSDRLAKTKDRFSAFMAQASSGGAVSLRNKELIAIALSVLSKCEPCVKIHTEKARAMGISEDEINEVVWIAIAFGGAPTLMFYDSIK